MKRRDLLKGSIAVCGAGLLSAELFAQENPNKWLLKHLCPPDGALPDMAIPSPKSRSFVMPLQVMPIKQAVAQLGPLATQLLDRAVSKCKIRWMNSRLGY